MALLPLAFLMLLTLTALVSAAPTMMRRELTRLHSGLDLQAALKQVIGAVPAARLLEIESSIRPTYEAFPKNGQGQLPPSEIVPAIVRAYFAKEHGWLIKGLEPALTNAMPAEVQSAKILQDRAPALATVLQSLIKANRGVSLMDIVGVTAALEQLILDDAASLLEGSYTLTEISPSEPASLEDLHKLLQSYLIIFRHGTPRNLTDVLGHQRVLARAKAGEGWEELVQFEEEEVLAAGLEGPYSPQATADIVRDIIFKYGKWQNRECTQMRANLQALERSRPGCVAFADFHAEPNHAVYQFTESEEYLRKIGATVAAASGDGTEVLVANYLLGPSNCIATSDYFSVCCLNECEQLLSELEKRVQAPALPAATLLHLVAALLPFSMDAPRELPAELRASLVEVERLNGGLVTLHSADFKRWMHSAFPEECPLPTAFESAAEESERASGAEWVDVGEECTRVPQWHPTMAAGVESHGDAEVIDV